MDTLEKAELTTSIRHNARILNQEYRFTIPKSRYNWKKNNKKTNTSKTAKRYVFHANAKNLMNFIVMVMEIEYFPENGKRDY